MTDTTTSLPARPKDLLGKVALITGASRGIGHAIAINFYSRGCSILGTCATKAGRTTITDLASTLGPIHDGPESSGRPPTLGLIADIYDPNIHNQLADGIEKFSGGKVDIFVNNAADPLNFPIGELRAEDIDRSLTANVRNPVLIVDELVRRKYFRKDSRIIYISSVRARQPWSEQLMYAAGKSAGESLCRTWAQAFGGRDEKFAFMEGTTANAVAVGLTATDSVMGCGEEAVETFKAEFLPLQSLPRMGTPEEVADVVGMLCGRDARWLTGTVVSASGGGIKIG